LLAHRRRNCNQKHGDQMSARPSPPPLPRKPYNWMPAIIVAFALTPLLILLIVFISYRVSNASAVRRLEAKIKQSGEPLTLTDLAATYPPIPDEDNGAVLLLQLWQKEDPEFWGAFMAGAHSLPTRHEPRWDDALPFLGAEATRISRTTKLSAENLSAAETFLAKRKDYFEKVRKALGKPKFRFPINIPDGYSALLPHLAQIKRLISQLVRVACYGMTLESAERLLSRQSLSTGQLEALATLLDQLEMPGALHLSFVSDRAIFLSVFKLPQEEVAQALSDERMNSSVVSGILRISGLKDLDCRLMLETMEKAIALADQDDAEALKDCEGLFLEAASMARRKPAKILSALLLPAEEKVAIKFATLDALRRSARAAIAVERYRLAHEGRRPEKLDDLVAAFLPQLPADPFDGEPLRYKQLPAGFVVYSIGPDRTDDGGTERPQRGPQKNYDVTFIVER
jgi:hypothetical protein